MIVTQAKASDLEEIARLVNSAYRGESSRRGWTTEADFLDGQRTDPASLREEMSKPGHALLCLRQDESGPILGCVALERFHDANGAGCYLGMLTVDPRLQAKGHGKLLLSSAESFARARGADRIVLGVIQLRDALIAWYERHGYRRTGATRPFPYGDERFGRPGREDLHFVMLEKRLS